MGKLGLLRTDVFDRMVRWFGEVPSFWYQRVGPCPVAHNDVVRGFSPNNACAICGGTNTAYRLTTARSTALTGGRVLTVNLDQQRLEQPFAVPLEAGDVFCAWIDTEYPFAEGDRLGLPTRMADFAEELVRGTGSGDRLRFTPALEVLAVYTPSGVLTSSAYALSADGLTLTFSGASAPAAGTQYTVRYRYRPSYIFVAQSFQRFPAASNGDLFPTLGVLRLFEQSQIDRKTGDQ